MNTWWWLLQRISGALLLGLMTVHLVLTHFVNPADAVRFATVNARLSTAPMILVDYSLLFLALFHGLYGLFVVLKDLLPRSVQPKVIAAVLTLIGVGLGFMGAHTLAVFTRS